jgi:hypothetical protein
VCAYSHGVPTALDLETGADRPAPTLRFQSVDPDLPPVVGGVHTVLLVPPGRVAPSPGPATVVVPAQPQATGQFLQAYVTDDLAGITSRTGPTLVEVVDRDGRVRPLQLLTNVVASVCTAITTYLICPTAPGQVSVWRYPMH